jgi:hypothetical protein
MALEDGIATLKQVVAETIKVQTAQMDEMQLTDKSTGDQYCIWIEDGSWQKEKGTCLEIENSPVSTSSEQLPNADTNTTTQTQQINQQIQNQVQQQVQQEVQQQIQEQVLPIVEQVQALESSVSEESAVTSETPTEETTSETSVEETTTEPSSEVTPSEIPAEATTSETPTEETVVEESFQPEVETVMQSAASYLAKSVLDLTQGAVMAVSRSVEQFIRFIFGSSFEKIISSVPFQNFSAGLTGKTNFQDKKSGVSEFILLTDGIINPIKDFFQK